MIDLPHYLSLPDIELAAKTAIEEDRRSGDVSAELLPADMAVTAQLWAKAEGTLCGQAWFDACFRVVDPRITIHWKTKDGQVVAPGDNLATLEGPIQGMLTAERSALNFLQTLSGTATRTQAYVERLKGYPTRLLDTRKTLPHLRFAQKYAVLCGGGHNHRLGLWDRVLLKENHLSHLGGVTQAVAAAKAHFSGTVEVEVETLEQLEAALASEADIVMLDNFDLATLRKAVTLTDGRKPLEASGNVQAETLCAIAATGVDYISIGDLTKSVDALDLSLLVETKT